jgi:hypothetical protein
LDIAKDGGWVIGDEGRLLEREDEEERQADKDRQQKEIEQEFTEATHKPPPEKLTPILDSTDDENQRPA